jgi:hypothetical protein
LQEVSEGAREGRLSAATHMQPGRSRAPAAGAAERLVETRGSAERFRADEPYATAVARST